MVVGEVRNTLAIKYSTKYFKAFALSENMQQNEGSQPDQSCELSSNMQPILHNLSPDNKNPSNFEGSLVGCVSNLNSNEYATSSGTSYNQQPETLNLPAVLWDKPLGSRIRVPPPVPPRSPRRPIDPITSGAFEAAMTTSSQEYISPQRGLPLGITLLSIKPLFVLC